MRSRSQAVALKDAAPNGDAPLPLAGSSAAAQRARTAFEDAVRGEAPVLMVSEPGLRADSVAAAIHERARRGAPLVTIDCAAADALGLEHVLFGVHTRAHSRETIDVVSSSSAILQAGDGTLYLKDVLELPARLQHRLSRILRDGEVRVRGRRVSIGCRVIAGCAPGIGAEVSEGHFRADLLQRLARVTLTIPALRERREDIPELTGRVVAGLTGGGRLVFTHAATTVLSAPSWVGNLDELTLVLDRLVRAGIASPIRQEDVLAHIPLEGPFVRVAPQVSLREARRQFEREYIAAVLERHRWRMSDAARTLGIERANLYRKARQLGITRGAMSRAVL